MASIQVTLTEIQRYRDTFIDRLQIPTLIQRAFEQNVSGKLPDDLYSEMVNGYQQERAELAVRVEELAATIEQAEKDSAGLQQFLELVNKYTHVQELDRALLNNLVDKIVIHLPEIDPETGKKNQRITIHYRFVGPI